MKVVIEIPHLHVTTRGNNRRHWRTEAAKTKAERSLARLRVLELDSTTLQAIRTAPRLRVRFVRVAPRRLDPTNLVSAFKAVQDGMCDAIGEDDRSAKYVWEWPLQEKGLSAVRIELEPETVEES